MTPKDIHTPFSALEKKENPSVFGSDNLSDFIVHYCDSYLKNNDTLSNKGGLYPLLISEIDRSLFRSILNHTKGNQSQTADILGINRNTLRKKLRTLGFNHEKK